MFSKAAELLSFGGDTAVGLSVGSSSIKLVELKKSRKAWKLLHFGMVQLPEDAIVNREIMNHVAVVESLKTLVNQLRLKSKNVCAALSGTSVIIKKMSLEVPNMRELQDQVFWEAEQYLPFDISDVVMDYELLNKGSDGRCEVILVAVKKTVLESYMTCVEDSGLKPKIVDVDLFALQNLYEANYPSNPNEAVAICDVGASSLKIVVVQNGVPVFTKDSAIGGRNLTAEIQKHLNLSFADAETLKVSGPSQGMPQEVSDLMHVMAENFVSEIKRAVDFYNASATSAPVAYVLLTGGSSRIPEFPKVVEDSVGVTCQLANPFNGIAYDPSVFTQDYIAQIAPVAAVPIGLALRMGAK